MKEKIYDIPLWDAFNLENCECPLCAAEKKAEDQLINSLFTEMVMDVRLNPKLVQEYRFCREHLEKLYKYPDKFGLAILTERILYFERESLKSYNAVDDNKSKSILGINFNRKKIAKHIDRECMLCKKVDEDMIRYTETMISLWCKEEKFKILYKNSRGFCIDHFSNIMETADQNISNIKTLKIFKEITITLQNNNIDRLHDELDWFITKFDFRYGDAPWKTSKDALKRTILKLTGNYNKEN
jgi:hypothetical protein